jgi:hypothetical protein
MDAGCTSRESWTDVPASVRARVTWSNEQVALGLPRTSRVVDPAWFIPSQGGEEGWSLVCDFDPAPVDQGNPSLASVHFMVDGAPVQRLQPGVTLRILERATQKFARIEILESASDRSKAADD